MSMEIHKHLQPTRSMTLKHGILGCYDCGMVDVAGIVILPIEVDTVSIKPPLASSDTIRIQTGNNLENIVVKKSLRLHIIKVSELFKNTLEHVVCWCFTAMDS